MKKFSVDFLVTTTKTGVCVRVFSKKKENHRAHQVNKTIFAESNRTVIDAYLVSFNVLEYNRNIVVVCRLIVQPNTLGHYAAFFLVICHISNKIERY